ncbi:MAG: protein kinase domain-containing protein [Myxococcales bacterium]|jgi:serine/threonine protein kinase
MEGRQISRYRVLEQIGSGGMSVVYKGLDTALEREVAIKVLHPHLAAKEESRRRFSREAKAVARLHHPNILEIFDFSGDDAPESFIVTEYIRGATLRTFAEKQRFHPPEIAAMAMCELAAALEHAHLTGVIHRDLKPENVMIRDDGVIKLMDFGIAKFLEREERMTMTGALVGSPAHMAPEIIEGLEAGREADVFSLGTILYWLCCGQLPFQGNNTTQTLKLILEARFPDPRIACPALSDELSAVIARCLAREPADRYSGAGEVRQVLAELLLDLGIERPDEEFAAFFADPEGYRSRFTKSLVETLLKEAERCASKAERNHARALKCLNRVLALDPGNPRAQALLDRMKCHRRRMRRLTVASAATAALLALAGAGFGVSALLESSGQHPATAPGAQVSGPKPGSPSTAGPSTPKAGSDTLADGPQASSPSRAATSPQQAGATTASDPSEVASPSAPSDAERQTAGPASALDKPKQASGSTAQARPKTRRDAKPAASAKPASAEAAALAKPGDGSEAEPAPAPDAERHVQPVEEGYLTIKTALGATAISPWAKIYVDGKWVNGQSPIWDGKLPVGIHKVRVEPPCCLVEEREIEVKEGLQNPALIVRLTPKPALLTVESSVDDLEVWIGDVKRGTARDSKKDPFTVPLPDGAVRGKATLRFFREGYIDQSRVESFEAGQKSVITVHMEKK